MVFRGNVYGRDRMLAGDSVDFASHRALRPLLRARPAAAARGPLASMPKWWLGVQAPYANTGKPGFVTSYEADLLAHWDPAIGSRR